MVRGGSYFDHDLIFKSFIITLTKNQQKLAFLLFGLCVIVNKSFMRIGSSSMARSNVGLANLFIRSSV